MPFMAFFYLKGKFYCIEVTKKNLSQAFEDASINKDIAKDNADYVLIK